MAGTSDSAETSIVVGEPKVFDTRTLELMLQDLDAQLRRIQAVDATKVSGTVGAIQGMQASSTELAVSLSGAPTPGVTLTEEANAAAGGLEDKTRSTSTAARSPSPPALETLSPLVTPATLSYGLSAQDLLSEQVNLNYQVYNLRMLLNRSVTDRYYSRQSADDKGPEGARLQAVIGFQISLDPRREHRSKAAIVEVEVRHKDANLRRPSLVTLMPLEKTYNAAALTKKSSSFGGAALVQLLSVGATLRRRGETFYLFQDADTLAFERPATNTSPLAFGWMFRPVLNQPSVSPGIRQLFAVVALDAVDAKPEHVVVTARTKWVGYDRRRRLPKVAAPEGSTAYENRDLVVPDTKTLQAGLGPSVAGITVSPLTETTFRVEVQGARFFSGVMVQLGDARYSAEAGTLALRSHREMQFLAPAKSALSDLGFVSGREYGLVVPLEDGVGKTGSGIRVVEVSRGGELKDGKVDLELVLGRLDPSGSGVPDLHGRDVFAVLGDRYFQLPANQWTAGTVGREEVLRHKFSVPVALVGEQGEIDVVVPFLGSRYRTRARLYRPIGAEKLIVLKDADPLRWGIVGHGFTKDLLAGIRVFAGKEFTSTSGLHRESDQLLSFEASRADLGKLTQVAVSLPTLFEPKVLAVPQTKLPPATPRVTSLPGEVAVNSAGTVEYGVEEFGSLKEIRFGGAKLPFQVVKGKLTVALTRDVTKAAGDVALLAYLESGTFVPLGLKVR